MSCMRNCQLCDRLILSTAVNYNASTNRVLVALPANAFENNEKYCIVLAQSIPTSALITAQVYFTVGSNATQYPFVNRNCVPVYATQVRTRRIYPVKINTAINAGVFKYVGNPCLPDANQTVSNSLPTV